MHKYSESTEFVIWRRIEHQTYSKQMKRGSTWPKTRYRVSSRVRET